MQTLVHSLGQTVGQQKETVNVPIKIFLANTPFLQTEDGAGDTDLLPEALGVFYGRGS